VSSNLSSDLNFKPARTFLTSKVEMNVNWALLASEAALFAFLVFGKLSGWVNGEGDLAGYAALGTLEICSAAVCLYLLYGSSARKPSRLDWIAGGSAALAAVLGFAAYANTLFAFYLILRDRADLRARAAGAVALAIVIQAIWAPLIFSKLSFIFLQIDAGVVGWLLGYVVPGAASTDTLVTTPSGHDVVITAACASFHNLSLASLCWVTLTMLHRPYWIRSDLYIGLAAVLVQFGLNVWRLVFVCMSLPMYEFWHEGLGKHIFSAVATVCAIVLVQLLLQHFDQNGASEEIAIAQ
jgi:hypothetical protein